MAKPKIEDPLIQRSQALRAEADSFQPLVERNMRRLADLEPDLARMRGSIGLDVAAATKGNARNTNDSLQAGLRRAKTLTTAAAQGEAQLRQANLLQRMSLGNKAIRGQAIAADQLTASTGRQMDMQAAKGQARNIRRDARGSLAGTLAGAAVSAGTSQQGQDFFRSLSDRMGAARIMRNPAATGVDNPLGVIGFDPANMEPGPGMNA